MENAQRNAENKIAVKWIINRPPKQVKVDKTGNIYTFVYKSHVCMAWVNEEDVPLLLNWKEKTCNCNHGTYKNAFLLANPQDVCLWETGDRCQ